MVTRRERSICGMLRFALLVAWTLASGLPTVQTAAAALTEYEVKAGFLYHFGYFVEWPATAVNGHNHPFIIGVLGADPFGSVLDEMIEGKTLHERPVVVKRFWRIEDAGSSDILFISASEEYRLPYILEMLERASVLTVSELERFTEHGGLIALRMVGRKVRFDINIAATARVGLKVSSQLLKLARVVYGTLRTGE
jgi:hypothetical protein